MKETILPENKQHWLECRTKDITSTEVGALFGLSPYVTYFELWHRKKTGVIVSIEENERMRWGLALQDAIAKEVAKEQGWYIRRMDEYIRDSELRVGASFDFDNHVPTGRVNDKKEREFEIGLLEIKNVDWLVFKNDWKEDEKGNLEAPLHIEIQVQHQLLVSDRQFAYIGVLVGGNELYLIKRTRDESVISAIRTKVSEFWSSVEAGIEPKPNFEIDAKFVSKMYGYAETGKVVDMSGEAQVLALAREYKEVSDIIKEKESRKEAIKAELLTIIKDSEKVLGNGFTISAGLVGPSHVEYDREGYRNFRINWKKEKV